MIRVFALYFEPDSADLPSAAPTVIGAAADRALAGHAVHISVVGYADAAEGRGDPQGLSERRARAVAAALVALGVPAAIIGAEGHGRSEPAVPTPDGVAEPLNRRASIALSF